MESSIAPGSPSACSATTRPAPGSRACCGRASGERVAAWRAELPRDRVGVVEVPLLFESGMEGAFDSTIAVIAEEDTREQRAGARGHTAVAERDGRQLTQQEKADKADFTVRNDGSLDELKQTLSRVLAKLAEQ